MTGYSERKAQLDQCSLRKDPVLVCDPRRQTNADLIWDATRLGWIGERVFDATYGEGVFWRRFTPPELVTNDLHKPAMLQLDYLVPMVAPIEGPYLTVVFDPPYMLNGKPTLYGDRYGTNARMPVAQRLAEIEQGTLNCAKLVAPDGTLLVKCMDQVSLFHVHRQTDLVIRALETLPGWEWIGMLELVEPQPRPQVKQVTPRFNRSTLLAFHRAPARKPRQPVAKARKTLELGVA